jgi:hypothetical protein
VFLLLLFFRMKYLMNSEHLYFPDGIFTQKLVVLFFRPEFFRLAIELNSDWNRVLVSCDSSLLDFICDPFTYHHECN